MKGGHGDNEDDVDIDSETGILMRHPSETGDRMIHPAHLPSMISKSINKVCARLHR
jgi:hypothetical protein